MAEVQPSIRGSSAEMDREGGNDRLFGEGPMLREFGMAAEDVTVPRSIMEHNASAQRIVKCRIHLAR